MNRNPATRLTGRHWLFIELLHNPQSKRGSSSSGSIPSVCALTPQVGSVGKSVGVIGSAGIKAGLYVASIKPYRLPRNLQSTASNVAQLFDPWISSRYYPFEVVIAGASPSAVLADQVKSLDWRKKRAKHKGKISEAELAEVRAKIRTLIG